MYHFTNNVTPKNFLYILSCNKDFIEYTLLILLLLLLLPSLLLLFLILMLYNIEWKDCQSEYLLGYRLEDKISSVQFPAGAQIFLSSALSRRDWNPTNLLSTGYPSVWQWEKVAEEWRLPFISVFCRENQRLAMHHQFSKPLYGRVVQWWQDTNSALIGHVNSRLSGN